MSKQASKTEETNAVKILEETARMRRSRSTISSIAGITILLLIALFIFDSISFFKTYDTEQIVIEVQEALPQILSSDSMQKLVMDLREKVIPMYINELSQKMNKAEPRFEAECNSAIAIMASEITTAVSERIVEYLTKILEETETMVLEKHPNLTDEDMTLILITLQDEIQSQYAERFGQQMQLLFGDIDQTLQSVRNDEERTALLKTDTTQLEKMLLTTALELAIYEIDPELGETL